MNVRTTASFNVYSAPADVALIYEVASRWFLSPEITKPAIQYGASTDVLFNVARNAFDSWKESPGALAALAHGETVANKPYLRDKNRSIEPAVSAQAALSNGSAGRITYERTR